MIVDKNNYTIDVFHRSTPVQGNFKSKGIERKRHLQQVMPCAEISGHVMEFGVYKGKTMEHITQYFSQDTVWGFDSFVGLPEPWFINDGPNAKVHPTGQFDLSNDPEQPVFAKNVRLVKGWFNETIPRWLEQNAGQIKFLHVDCDLYTSTKTVLTNLNERIVSGTVIAFDEMYPWADPNDYNLWAQGEFRALGEWIDLFDRRFRPLLRSRHQQCSIMIL